MGASRGRWVQVGGDLFDQSRDCQHLGGVCVLCEEMREGYVCCARETKGGGCYTRERERERNEGGVVCVCVLCASFWKLVYEIFGRKLFFVFLYWVF